MFLKLVRNGDWGDATKVYVCAEALTMPQLPFLKLYTMYINTYQAASDTLEACMANLQFSAFITVRHEYAPKV